MPFHGHVRAAITAGDDHVIAHPLHAIVTAATIKLDGIATAAVGNDIVAAIGDDIGIIAPATIQVVMA